MLWRAGPSSVSSTGMFFSSGRSQSTSTVPRRRQAHVSVPVADGGGAKGSIATTRGVAARGGAAGRGRRGR
ncbi:MAG: hypothetical protein IPJ04_17720 [Candidatus Eisenbacteria bacterium]|nr:hypothetical protein [Candidatus Eisenbacteria bacterium]